MKKEDVQHVAHLARLSFGDEALEAFTGQMNGILKYIEQLSEVDTEGVEPMAQPTPLENVWRADEVTGVFPQDKAMMNTKHSEEGYFEVPAVLAGEEDPA